MFLRDSTRSLEDVGTRMLQCPGQMFSCWTVRQLADIGCRRSLSSLLLFTSFFSKIPELSAQRLQSSYKNPRWWVGVQFRGTIESKVEGLSETFDTERSNRSSHCPTGSACLPNAFRIVRFFRFFRGRRTFLNNECLEIIWFFILTYPQEDSTQTWATNGKHIAACRNLNK